LKCSKQNTMNHWKKEPIKVQRGRGPKERRRNKNVSCVSDELGRKEVPLQAPSKQKQRMNRKLRN